LNFPVLRFISPEIEKKSTDPRFISPVKARPDFFKNSFETLPPTVAFNSNLAYGWTSTLS